MPNWCYNRLEVYTQDGDAESTKQLRDFKQNSIVTDVNDDGTTSDRLTFEDALPMPSSLRITSGSSTDQAIMYCEALDGHWDAINKDIEQCKWLVRDGVVLEKDSMEIKQKKYMKYLEDKLDLNDIEEGRMAIENQHKYGSKDWYDWSIKNWGCKWNASGTCVDDFCEDYVYVSFESPWSPPMGWFEAVSKKYPKLLFKMRVEEESEAFIGLPVAQNGVVCDNFVDIRYPDSQ